MLASRKHFCELEAEYEKAKLRPNLNLWRRFKKYIRKITVVSERHPKTKYMFRSTYTVMNETIRHSQSKFWFSIHPYSSFNYVWQFIMCFVHVLIVATNLLEVTFITKSEEAWCRNFIMALPFLYAISTIDICLNFITGYIQKVKRSEHMYTSGLYNISEQIIILEHDKIACHYLRTYFFFDSINFLTIIMLFFDPYLDRQFTAYVLAWVRMLRHIRFFTVFETVKTGMSMVKYPEEWYNIFVVLFLFIYLNFVLTCMHILLPDIVMYFEDKTRDCVVVELRSRYELIGRDLTDFEMYCLVNFITFVTMVGTDSPFYNRNNFEGYFVYICCLILGWLFKVFFFITVLKILTNLYRSRVRYRYFLKGLSSFEMVHELDRSTMQNINAHFARNLRKEFFNEGEILRSLQPYMRYEIFAQSSMNLIRTCHLFTKLPYETIAALASRLVHESYSAGSLIVRTGEMATCMYFIATGTAAVFGSHGREICHLSDGDYFGEIGLIRVSTSARVATVLCVEPSELYRLDVQDYHEIVQRDSAFDRQVRRLAMKRLQERRMSRNVAV